MEVGGQAVIEGVMMRNKERFAVAVRLPNGEIKVKQEQNSTFPSFFKFPFLRGIVGLGYTLYDGIRALIWSSNENLGVEEKLTKKEIIGTIFFSFLASALIFVVVPFLLARYLTSTNLWFNILDGLLRTGLFLGYVLLISTMKDVKTLFQYHGAEHKTIYCYEEGKPLTVENVRPFTRFHPRCGTTFIFILLLLSIFLFTLIPGSFLIKFLGRLLLLPVLAGIGYELIKLSSKHYKNTFVKIFIAPGLWLQRITTKEPNDTQLEVSIKALKAVVE